MKYDKRWVMAVAALLCAAGAMPAVAITLVAPTFGAMSGTAQGAQVQMESLAGEPVVGVSAFATRSLASGFVAVTQGTIAPLAVDPFGQPLLTAFIGAAPNPFVSATRIGFTLAERMTVDVRVFDLAGRQVRELGAGSYGPGAHELNWRGETDAGHRSAPGMYLVRMRLGSRVTTRNVVRLR